MDFGNALSSQIMSSSVEANFWLINRFVTGM